MHALAQGETMAAGLSVHADNAPVGNPHTSLAGKKRNVTNHLYPMALLRLPQRKNISSPWR